MEEVVGHLCPLHLLVECFMLWIRVAYPFVLSASGSKGGESWEQVSYTFIPVVSDFGGRGCIWVRLCSRGICKSGVSHLLCVLWEVSVCWCVTPGMWWISSSSRVLRKVAIFRQNPVFFPMEVFTEMSSVFSWAENLVFPGFTKRRMCVLALITKFAPISFGFVRIS